jgi:hypothetical protein
MQCEDIKGHELVWRKFQKNWQMTWNLKAIIEVQKNEVL